MRYYVRFRFLALLFGAIVLMSCGGGTKVNVQATVDAAVAATASAQGRLQAAIDAAVAATQVARTGAEAPREAVTPTVSEFAATAPTESPALPTEPSTPVTAEAPVTPARAESRCEVASAGLNLRAGPGQVFDPPLRSLPRGTALVPLSFVGRGFPSGEWVEVQVVVGGQLGWVSAGAQFVSCNIDVKTLPLGSAPPTPTPRPSTATPTRVSVTLPPPPATPTRLVPLAVLPVDGGGEDTRNIRNGRNVKEGRNVLLPGFDSSEVGTPMVFRDRIVFRVEVFDRNVGQTDGAGIASVSFTITGPNGTVHERTERVAGYCVFGGGEPDCTVWRFSEHNNKWPGGAAVQSGTHNVKIVITPQNGSPVSWFWTFEVE